MRIKKGKEKAVGAAELQTPKALKRLLGHYAANADVSYLILQGVYGKVELLPYFCQLGYGYATLEFKNAESSKNMCLKTFLRFCVP